MIYDTLCNGDSLYFGGSYYSATGSYIDSALTTEGCDSVVTLELMVNPTYAYTIYDTLCNGDSLYFGGSYYSSTGTYIDSALTTEGCDSVVTLELTVNPTYAYTIYDTLCNGDSLYFGGSYYSATGSYIDSALTTEGCDSVVTLELTVNPTYAYTIYDTLCSGDSLYFGGSYYSATGTYIDSALTTEGCDSVVTLELTVNPTYAYTIYDTLCNGDSLYFGGSYYSATGSYIDSALTTEGCDSVVTLELTVNPTYAYTIYDTLCNGDSLFFGGSYYSVTGSYIDSALTTEGCDSVVTLELTVNPTYAYTIYDTLCNGDSLYFGGSYHNVTGTYIDSALTTEGCDSVVTLELTVNPTYAYTIYDTLCNGDSLYFGGSYYSATGTYVDSALTTEGCDSVVTLELTVNPTYAYTIYDTLCNGDSLYFGGSYYNVTGTYIDSALTTEGCDSVVTLELTVNPTYAYTIYDTLCNGDSLYFGGSYYSATGSYIDSALTTEGCDSVVTLELTVNPTYAYTIYDTLCNGDSLYFGGSYYSTTGTYIDSALTTEGCDSVVTLELTVNPTYAYTIYDTLCNGDSLYFGGSYYNVTGTYIDSAVTTEGCDSVVTLELTVNPTYAYTIYDTLCNGDSLYFGGSYYSTTGTYIDSALTTEGCDSVVTLELTVNPTYAYTIYDTLCNGDSLFFGGSYYSVTGSYIDSALTTEGCDSVVTLELTVNPTYAYTIYDTLCNGDSLYFGGSYHNVTGTYIDSALTTEGCDSVVTLELTVNPTYAYTIYDTLCNGDSLYFGGSYYNVTGTYIDSALTTEGCDSVVTLELTVNPTFAYTIYDTLCNGDSLYFGGSYYNVTGTYIDSALTTEGCDSVVTLELTVNPTYAYTIYDTLCNGDSLYFGGSYYNVTGTYYRFSFDDGGL